MENYILKNRTVMNVRLKEEVYYIEIAMKRSFLEGLEDSSFILTNRYNVDDEIRLDFYVKNKMNDYILFEVKLPYGSLQERLVDGEMWDLHIVRQIEGQPVKSRIKSNDRQLNFFSILHEERKKMFYPLATKKGNLSFFANDYKLFSFIEDIELRKDGMLGFKGHFNYPPLFQTDEIQFEKVELLVRNNINDDEITFPLTCLERKDLLETFPGIKLHEHIGFQGDVDLRSEMDVEQPKYFMFHIVMHYKKDGKMEELRSVRMKCVNLKGLSEHRIIKINDKMIQLILKSTKLSKFLSLSANKYNYKAQIIKKAKSKWVKTRRSNRLKRWYKSAFAAVSLFIPVHKKLVVFESYHGKQYSDSPRAIYEYMKVNNPEYKLVWSVDRASTKYFSQKDVEYVRRFSIRWLLMMTRAKYWINNVRFPLWIPKPKHTIYIQTWHGTPLKRLAMDMDEVHMPGTSTHKYKTNFLKEASNWDYLVSPNAYSTKIFQRAFQFDRKMIESGYPRNDFLYRFNNEEKINELKGKFNIPLDKKIILYAPTWRDNQFFRKGKYKFNLELDLKRMQEELGDSYIVIMRMHYLVAQNMDLSGFEGFAYDFSHLEDIRELYLISDILVTDYSSVFFDYANLRRPMIFFTYDIEDYRDNLRGFYFDFEEKAPGLLARTTEELIEEVNNISRSDFKLSERFEEFYEKFCYLECGESSKRVVNEVFEKGNPAD
ncbi:CDP-glycerol glycerophosphotransferase family protein [Peribacillus muralis]|uniref:CDP-glycerol glycerophosphotransferase family protein n=1 Tax=Peribacillus muralis TaxID=264697 RepID=UPI003D033345